jgi:hypothetical protein
MFLVTLETCEPNLAPPAQAKPANAAPRRVALPDFACLVILFFPPRTLCGGVYVGPSQVLICHVRTRHGVSALAGREGKSLHVLEGLLILQTDLVDQLGVDNDALL